MTEIPSTLFLYLSIPIRQWRGSFTFSIVDLYLDTERETLARERSLAVTAWAQNPCIARKNTHFGLKREKEKDS